jgi:hypothetical protein
MPLPALYRKSDLCIPRNETARPRSQFLHSCLCEGYLYFQDRYAYLAAAKCSKMLNAKKGGLVIVGFYLDNFSLLLVGRQGFKPPVLASDWLGSLQIRI